MGLLLVLLALAVPLAPAAAAATARGTAADPAQWRRQLWTESRASAEDQENDRVMDYADEGAADRKDGGSSEEAGPAAEGGRFLLPVCVSGRYGNQVVCLRNYLRLARALNRTLLIPSYGVAYSGGDLAYKFHWANIVDWAHMRVCFQDPSNEDWDAVLTFDEYFAKCHCSRIVLGAFVCVERLKVDGAWACLAEHKPLAMRDFLQMHQPQLVFPPYSHVQPHRHATANMTWKTFTRIAKQYDGTPVITFGYLENFADWMWKHAPPLKITRQGPFGGSPASCPPSANSLVQLAHGNPNPGAPCCPLPWQPPAELREVITLIRKTFFPDGYAALHMRRDDMYSHFKEELLEDSDALHARYPSAVDKATSLGKTLKARNLSALFVATDAWKMEAEVFKSTVSLVGGLKRAMTFRDILTHPDFAAIEPMLVRFMNKETLEMGKSLTLAIIDKSLCVAADIFFGSPRSSFTLNIQALRAGVP